MPLFGAHMSVAGGCHNALLAARAQGCESVQLFTKNANTWNARDLTADEVRLFRRTLRETGLRYTVAHDFWSAQRGQVPIHPSFSPPTSNTRGPASAGVPRSAIGEFALPQIADLWQQDPV